MKTDFKTIHADSIVIDAVCPLLAEPKYIEWYRCGGATVVAPTVAAGPDGVRVTLDRLAQWARLFATRSDLLLVRKAEDVETAKRTGRMGIFLHFQGTGPIEDNLDLVDLYKAFGVGVIQLAYNVKNPVGDGCEERTDAGLSKFGVALIRRMNEARVIVDCSHTGFRTSMDALEVSTAPVILSHANARAVHGNKRNVSDELIKAIAASGGVVGTVGFPAFVSNSPRPSLEQMLAHIDHVVELIGIDHAGLGIDYYRAQAGVMDDTEATRLYEHSIRIGKWTPDSYPPPPHHYPAGIETPKTLFNLTDGLLRRGYSVEDTRKVLGGNWLRVMRAVWG